MVTTRSTGKLAQVGPPDPEVSQISSHHVLPAGRTPRPAGEDDRVSRMVDHVDQGPGRQRQGAHRSGQALDELPVLEQVCRRQARLPPIFKSQWRAHLNNIGDLAYTSP